MKHIILLVLALLPVTMMASGCKDILYQDSTEYATEDSVQRESLSWEQQLSLKIDRLIYDSQFLRSSQLGLVVYDLERDTTLFAYNARQAMRPASTMKLVTAITALDRLGYSYEFATRLKYIGTVCDSTHTLNGDVYITGGMDPLFGSDDLMSFVQSIKSMGVDTIRGNICIDKSMKESLPYGEGWCWDDKNPILSPCVYNREDNPGDDFAKLLKRNNVFLDGDVVERVASKKAIELSKRTHTINQMLNHMMKESDNLYAECLYYQLDRSGGTATAKGARKTEQALITKINRNPADYRLADGSGLSLYNYITPDLEVALLRYAFQNRDIFPTLYKSLPVAGVDGTLDKRMKGTSAARNVHAKTGTLTAIYSLAGYATAKNGHMLAFCIINQGALNSAKARDFQDKVCILLTE